MDSHTNSKAIPYRMSSRAYWRLSPIIHEFVNTFPDPVLLDCGDLVPTVLTDRIRGVIKGQLMFDYDKDMDNIKLLNCWHKSRVKVVSDDRVEISMKTKPKLKKTPEIIKNVELPKKEPITPVRDPNLTEDEIKAFYLLVDAGHLPIPIIFKQPQHTELFKSLSEGFDVIVEVDKEDNIMIT